MAPEWLSRVVRSALDTRVRACRRPVGGALADTYVLSLAGAPGRVVCKRGGANVWTGDVIEPLVARTVAAETSIPIPAVLASGSIEGPGDGGAARWALYEYCEGRPAGGGSSADRAWLAERSGALLGRLHTAGSFDRRGGLARDGTTLRVRPAAASGVLESRVARRLATVGPATDPVVEPVLDHGDYRPGNLLATDDRVTAVIDWGNAHVTHPGLALARAEVRFADLPARSADERRALRRRFRGAYTDERPLPATVETELPLLKALWCGQAAANLAGVARTRRGRRQLSRQLRERLCVASRSARSRGVGP